MGKPISEGMCKLVLAFRSHDMHNVDAMMLKARPPRSVEEALTSPHGRPAVPLLGFGFGGRIIAMLPQPSPGFGSSRGSSLSNSSLKVFHMDNLAAQIQEAYHYTQSQEVSSAKLGSLKSLQCLLFFSWLQGFYGRYKS